MSNRRPLPNQDALVLSAGKHGSREQGMCLLEAVAWFAGEPHSDHPECVDVALAAYGRVLNDLVRDDERQALLSFVPGLVGTRGSRDIARRRAYLLVDRYMRGTLPAFLRELPSKPRPDLAAQLETLSPIVDGESAHVAHDVARACRFASPAVSRAASSVSDVSEAASNATFAAAYTAASAASAASAATYVAADIAYAAVYDAIYAICDADTVITAFEDLRKRTVARAIEAFEEAIREREFTMEESVLTPADARYNTRARSRSMR